jgi:hypothetical protein
MSEEGRGRELPRRVRAASPSGPAQSTAPALSEELRQRMQAAVKAERDTAKAQPEHGDSQERPGEQPRRAGDAAVSPVINGTKEAAGGSSRKRANISAAAGGPQRSAVHERHTRSGSDSNGRTAAAERKGRARPSDGNTRTGTAIQPPSGATPIQPGTPTSRRRARLGALAAALIIVLALGVVLIRVIGSGRGTSDGVTLSEESSLRGQAADWVTQDVSPGTSVSCDQVMCAALKADSFGGKLVVLGPASPEPPDSALVVVTPAVQSLYGTSLSAAWAPSVLASFGSGAAEVSVRIIAPHGVGSYQAQAKRDQANRIAFGTALLNLNPITLSALAQQQLTTGRVDQRLVLALAALATKKPIDILDFASNGPGQSGDVPFRVADLAATDPSANLAQGPYVRAMHAFLDSSQAPFPTTSSVQTLPSQVVIFTVVVDAPTPPGQVGQQLP